MAEQPVQTHPMEIPGSPLSRHDLEVIREQLTRARLLNLSVLEIHVSTRRMPAEGLLAFGVSVRSRGDLGLNEGVVVAEGHPPIGFDFEGTA